MDLKQKRLDLMDNLLKLRDTDEAEFNAIKETCDTLIKEIKETKDEIRIAKIKNEIKADLSGPGREECIGALKKTADDILRFKRMLDNLKPEEKTVNHSPVEQLNIIKKIRAKAAKKETLKEYDNYLVMLCKDMKNIIIKLDNLSSVKQYDFVVEFAEYFIEAVPRTFANENYFHNDVIVLNSLYKKIYDSIERLEKS